MSFYTYMLQCSDGSFYVGHTDNLEARLAQHEHGEIEGYTQRRRPVKLVWSETFATRIEALTAERQIKGWSRAKKSALIENDWATISRKARKPGSGQLPRPASSTGSAATQDDRHSRSPNETDAAEDALPERQTPGSSSPAIVLVRPQLGENIGQAARAMLNFGLTDLRLVSPRDGWPNPAAGPAAAGADAVLADARVYDTVADAVADCQHVMATTVRRRGLSLPAITPDVAAARIRGGLGRTAILFGPERSGLETDDVAVAGAILTVPVNPAFGSLNLAQAVVLVAYEWSRANAFASPTMREDLAPPAPMVELDGLIDQLDTALVAVDYFHPPDRTPVTRQAIRTMLTKPRWSAPEVRMLRGMLRALTHPRHTRVS